MKVCLINNLFYPFVRGGAEQVAKNVAEGLVKSGYEVVVITTKPSFEKAKKEHKDIGIKIHRFFPWNLFWIGNIGKYPAPIRLLWHFGDMFNIHSYFKIRRILKKEKPDLVITHNLKGIGYLTPLAVKRLDIKYFHTIHDVQLAIPSGLLIKGKEGGWQVVLGKLYEKINKKLFSYPEKIISPSRWLLDFYSQKGFFKNQKKVILPNPTNHCHPRGGGDPVPEDAVGSRLSGNDKNIESSYKLQATSYKLLYVGQIEKHKGILFLLDAINKTKEENFELIVVGGGSKEEEVKKIAKKNTRIKFLGRLPNDEVVGLYKKADITIVPSLCYENSPTVIFESLSFGTPVLASRLGGVSEIIREGENGYTFIAGDKKDLIEKIKFCLSNKERVNDMREETIKSVEGGGCWELY